MLLNHHCLQIELSAADEMEDSTNATTTSENLNATVLDNTMYSPAGSGQPASFGNLGLYDQPFTITLTILFSAVTFFGVFLNSIIVFTVYRCPEMRTPCNLLIVNIAISDLAVASLAAPLRIIEVFVGWPFGEFLCRLLVPMQDLFVTVSVVTHTTIALERFRAIVRPLKRRLSQRDTKFVILAIWPACYIAASLPVAPVLKVQYYNGFHLCMQEWPFDLYRTVYQVYLVVVFILIPVFIQSMAYFKILKTLQTRLVPLCALPSNRMLSRAIQFQKRRRLIKTLAILVFSFQICFIPRGVMLLVHEFGRNLNLTVFWFVWLITLIIFYLKHVMNPIILFATSSEFRRSNCLHIMCQ